MLHFWDVADRAINTGRLMKMKDFDFHLFRIASRLVKEYDIKYDPAVPIPSDDGLADRVFEAGLKLYLETGSYCIDTGRVIQFDDQEIREALEEVDRGGDSIEIGDGLEKRRLFKRRVEDPRKPMVLGGVVESNPREGRDFVQLYKSIAQERIVDGIYYGPPTTIEGKKWVLGSPLDCHASISASGWMREVLRSVGRPGLHLRDACPSAIGGISVCDPQNGIRKTDAIALPTISELKVNFETLNKVAYSLHYGCLRTPYWTSMIGGFAGGPEGCAIANVAGALNAVMVYRVGGGGYVMNATLLVNPPINTVRPAIWVRSLGMQAITRNMNLIVGGGGLTAAGPGTEQQLWEIASLGIHFACSGGHVFNGARKSVLVKPTQGSGMEPRWEGEVAQAAAGLSRYEANEVTNFVLSHYENHVSPDVAPEGFGFDELYDYESVRIKPRYLDLYAKVKLELQQKGLQF